MTQALASCRIQLRNGLDFDGLIERLDYFDQLGISHLYLSPIFTAASGSTHGYDCVDPNTIDPVLGGEAGFVRLCTAVRRLNMGLILDIVPNHLGVGPDNVYWQALLRDGPNADSASIFDVDWESLAGGTPGKILLPILGEPLPQILKNKQLSLIHADEPAIQYFEHRFPLAPDSLLESVDETLPKQHWQLAWWRSGNRFLNWRRFFDITTLAGVRVEDPTVFEQIHRKTFELLQIDVVQGLRIDHIDGLADPGQYLERLDRAWRDRRSDHPWLLVEKILANHESLPDTWNTDGTTGYETLNRLTSIFIHPQGVATLKQIWSDHGQDPASFQAELAQAKREILTVNLEAELNRLTMEICRHPQIDFSAQQITEALIRLIIATDCYRSYGAAQTDAFEHAMQAADWSSLPEALPVALATALPASGLLRQRFEQLSAPAMAKSLEDTVFYRWYPVLALNEVGGEPDQTPSLDEIHRAFSDPARTRPKALIPTATHDTKRGEDARLRLAMLTHPALNWAEELSCWHQCLQPIITDRSPDNKAMLLILQTIYSIWPIDPATNEIANELLPRLKNYFTKAFREAKEKTSWLYPDEAFERDLHEFVASLIECAAFRKRLENYLKTHEASAQRLSLAMTAVKLCLPGIPDLYHGAERQDLSLVDPDNRRPVDINQLCQQLAMASDGADAPNAKQHLIQRLLSFRRQKPNLFLNGLYRPIVLDDEQEAVFAFERTDGDDQMIVVAQRWTMRPGEELPVPPIDKIVSLLNGQSWYELVSQKTLEPRETHGLHALLNKWSVSILINDAAG